MAEDSITREEIAYLVCRECGVVFPDRDEPKCCPICAAAPERFVAYDEYLRERATS